ncbi:Protein mcm10 [Fasciolopsis buskii]|uniref:Protein mcm10 n=1 Tax=Fasciolopsis buskii TaxID=27845 RepID=A0A8E0VP94_9TREM|nr:Protein mcm10 [Fasciolopsis buski]
MVDDAEDLFVIDKKGAEELQPSNIVYYFKSEDEQQSPKPSSEAKPARQRRGPVGKRYHEADDFNKFRPGHLSRELRRALNLDRHEIPVHVYRMRSLGYPPGWLRKARVGGGLMMFDSVTALAENEEG